MPSFSKIGDLSCITSCLVLPGFLMDTLLIRFSKVFVQQLSFCWGGGGGRKRSEPPASCNLYLPTSPPHPFSFSLQSTVNKETQKTYLPFSSTILWGFFSFFPLSSALLLFLVSFDSLSDNISCPMMS